VYDDRDVAAVYRQRAAELRGTLDRKAGTVAAKDLAEAAEEYAWRATFLDAWSSIGETGSTPLSGNRRISTTKLSK